MQKDNEAVDSLGDFLLDEYKMSQATRPDVPVALPLRPKPQMVWDAYGEKWPAIDKGQFNAYADSCDKQLSEALATLRDAQDEVANLRLSHQATVDRHKIAVRRIQCAWCGWATEPIEDKAERWKALQSHREECWPTHKSQISEGGVAYITLLRDRKEQAEATVERLTRERDEAEGLAGNRLVEINNQAYRVDSAKARLSALCTATGEVLSMWYDGSVYRSDMEPKMQALQTALASGQEGGPA